MPATSSGECKIGADELAEINAFSGKNIRKLAPVRPWSGIQLQKHPQAEFVPQSGNLLVERRVGRGRIVASAFRLGDREFANWPGVDEFFNAFLLGRPPRRFAWDQEAELKVLWADGHERLDAARISNLRFFTRDAGLKWENYCPDIPKDIEPPIPIGGNPDGIRPDANLPDFGPLPPPGPGVAAWNDFSPVAAAARESLLNAAQVEIPDRTFVFLFLFVYLIVLVPFNWSIFHTFDRVEWAWIAAPIVAIISTVLVIKLAQLDIGFVRARTEIAVLEIQGDHSARASYPVQRLVHLALHAVRFHISTTAGRWCCRSRRFRTRSCLRWPPASNGATSAIPARTRRISKACPSPRIPPH